MERIRVDMGGTGRWVGSAGHEEVLKLTDLKDIFEDEEEEVEESGDEEQEQEVEKITGELLKTAEPEMNTNTPEPGTDDDDNEEEEEAPKEKKRKRTKQDKDELAGRKKKGRNQIDSEPSFFSDL